MLRLISIVEGPGDVIALPVLLSRLLYDEKQRYDIHVSRPIAANGGSQLIVPGGLENYLERTRNVQNCLGVLLLLDADENCPKEIAKDFAERARKLKLPHPVAIVIANCEYEAWFLASLETIAGKELEGRPGLSAEAQFVGDVEEKRGVKEWLTKQLPPAITYKETLDQVIMTRMIDPERARQRSRSFRRLCHALTELLEAAEQRHTTVTPESSTSPPKIKRKRK